MKKKLIKRYAFISALKEYDNKLAERLSANHLGIYTNSKLYTKTSNVSDIVFSSVNDNLLKIMGATKENISITILNQLANNVREIKNGVAVINNKGIYFFIIESMVYNNITAHYFFPLEQLPKIDTTIKRAIYFQKPFTLKNIYPDSPIEDYYKTQTLDYKHTRIDRIYKKLSETAITLMVALPILFVILCLGVLGLLAILLALVTPFI